MMKYQNTRENILELLERNRSMDTQELADALNMSRGSIANQLIILLIHKKIRKIIKRNKKRGRPRTRFLIKK